MANVLHPKPYFAVERPPTGVLRKFGEGVPPQALSSSSDLSSKLPGSYQNSPRVSSKWDVNVTELNQTKLVILILIALSCHVSPNHRSS
ncbi:hypothetical protein AVEN_123104-1 [Araneus ventricosus]|uniref:Uncharacterized protein n=1 Tax=Araneus ventricosus TaxID=182803 RepID=A0A4Y2L030_ARAVE|nr:hypothetical protein AVEN_123104-1 [Araneus ventricosus]